MILIPRERLVDEGEDNETTLLLVDVDGDTEMKTPAQIKELRRKGHTVVPTVTEKSQEGAHQSRAQASALHTAKKSIYKPIRASSAAKMKKRGGYVFSVKDARKGGQRGGKARAAAMSKKQRSESARKAVLARWRKAKKR
jgi:hypothetical protein